MSFRGSVTTRTAAAVSGLCLGLAAVPALAAQPAKARIAVLPADVGTGTERVEQTVSARLLDGLKRGHFEVVVAPTAALTDPCTAPQCEAAVAREASARYVIRATVSPQDNIYRILLEARDEEGQVVASAEDVCEICGLTELGDLVSDRGAALAQQIELLSAAPPLVIVNTNPSGANVWIDDQLVGRTPLEHQVAAGSHEIRVESDGYVGQRRTVESVAGVREEVEINLALDASAPAHPGRGMIIGGVVALVAGIGLVGGGVPLIVIDDRSITDPCDPDPQGNCREKYDTIGLGAGFAGLGAAAIAAGVTLLAVGLTRRNKAKARFAASHSGVLVRF